MSDQTVSVLSGEDGNAFAVMARVKRALRAAGRDDLVEPYQKAATSGDYDNLLQESTRYLDLAGIDWT